jgi:hypothetical protein
MTSDASISLRKGIILFLRQTFRVSPESAGWGLTKKNLDSVSITNTAEALLACSHMDAIDEVLLKAEDRDAIIRYLSRSFETSLTLSDARLRDIAFASMGLHLLNHHEYRQSAIEKLNELACSGGWRSTPDQPPSLITTFHAMRALQIIGGPISESHYSWLRTLQKANDLFTYAELDDDTYFASSCIALYIASQGPERGEPWIVSASTALKERFPDALSRFAKGEFDWVSKDPYTGFKILGYGHGLMALHLVGIDLFEVGIETLLSPHSNDGTSNTEVARYSPFVLKPETTWVPAVLELVVALSAVKLNFDPLRHYDLITSRINKSLTREMELEKAKQSAQSDRLRAREDLIDARDEAIIRSRLELKEMQHGIVAEVKKLHYRTPTLGQFLALTGSVASLIALALVFIDKLAQSRNTDPQLIIWRIVLAIGALLIIAAVLTMFYFRIRSILNSNRSVNQKVLRTLAAIIVALAITAVFADGLYAALYWRWWLGSLIRATASTLSSPQEGLPPKKGPAGAISKETLSRLTNADRNILIGNEVASHLIYQNSDEVEGFYVQSWSLKGSCGPALPIALANSSYTVELRSAEFDPYLIVSDNSDGISEDDDSGGGHNARLTMRSMTTSKVDDIRIGVTSALPGEKGAFTLRVRCGS